MEVIRKQRNVYAVFSTVGVFLTAVFYAKYMLGAAIFGFASIILILLLVKKSFQLYDARLIWDNRILVVPSAIVVVKGSDDDDKKDIIETVISTFGVMIGSKIYKWGCDGIEGIRLCYIEINKERIYITFGNASETLYLELLHSIADEKEMMDLKEKIWRETGISAVVSCW